MRALPDRTREINAFLPAGPDEIEEKLDTLETSVLHLTATPTETDPSFIELVLRARLDGAHLALDAAQASMLHAGARAYIAGSVYSRRLREFYFVSIVTPATKHLRKDLGRKIEPFAGGVARRVECDLDRHRMHSGNIFANIPERLVDEQFLTLLASPNVKIERIVSMGHASPPGFWFDQERTEWVLILSGSAGLRIEGEDATRTLVAGDYVELPPHTKHRVEWTDADQTTIWLAVYLGDPVSS